MPENRGSPRGIEVASAANPAVAEFEKLVSKQRFKEAVKQAKLIHKAEPTAANHQRLEQAYFQRARQLLAAEMPESAVEVARHLLGFGVTDARLVEQLPAFLVAIGLTQDAHRIADGADSSPAKRERLMLLAADQAVLHPERTKRATAEVPEAALVRQAIDALYAGDDDKALGLVRDIPRSSPVSEWKLFVRGLSAFYKNNLEEAEANWSRLDPERAALRIVRRLRTLHASEPGQAADAAAFEKLERVVHGETILPRLSELAGLVGKNNWVEVLKRITGLRLSLRSVAPGLEEKLTAGLLVGLMEYASSLDYDSGTSLIRRFMEVAAPLGIDPRWNRFWAVVWEQHGAAGAISYWTRYVADLGQCEALKAEERPLAQAIVLNRIAEIHLEELVAGSGEDHEFPDFDFDDDDTETGPDDDMVSTKEDVIESIERSLQLAPRYRPTYDMLLELGERTGDQEVIHRARKRILEVFPDDTQTLVAFAKDLYERDDVAGAFDSITRARKLKPLDEDLIEIEVRIRTSLARRLALERRWDEGRAQFAAIEQLRPGALRSYAHLAWKAIFEIKASQRDAADRYEQAAATLVPEPAPLWLVFRVGSVLYKLTRATQKHYLDLWKMELKRKCRSETAGAMASFWMSMAPYHGRESDTAELLKYLRRSTRLNYRLADLEQVCALLLDTKTAHKLVCQLAERGLKTYPNAVKLHLAVATGWGQDSQGWRNAHKVRAHLENALELAESSSQREDRELLPVIRRMLTVHTELMSQQPILDFPFPLPGTKSSGRTNSRQILDAFRVIQELIEQQEAAAASGPQERE